MLGQNVHKFQLSVLIALRVDPANVGVGCANVLMANGFSNGSDARANWLQQSVGLAVPFGGRSGGGTLGATVLSCVSLYLLVGTVSSVTGCRREWVPRCS